MQKAKFDMVMDYIDKSIKSDNNAIKKEIHHLTGINSNIFDRFFVVMTEETLGKYIDSRRLYYAALELIEDKEKAISAIALEYGYSDQSSFTRAFKKRYGISPMVLRKNNIHIENNRYYYTDFVSANTDSRYMRIWEAYERKGYISGFDLDYLEAINQGHEEYGFEFETCKAIADLADKLEIPVAALMESCSNLVVEIKSDSDYYPKDIMLGIALGLSSSEELEKICQHYDCRPEELDDFMINAYYELFD